MNTSGKSCRYYTTLEEFWNDALGSRIDHKDVLLLCKDAFTAGAFAAMWLRDHNIDPFRRTPKDGPRTVEIERPSPMTIRSIVARCSCDHCGSPFEVNLDAAVENIPKLFDYVESEMSNGILGHSLEGGLHLCGACTRIVAHNSPTDEPLDRTAIEAILNRKTEE